MENKKNIIFLCQRVPYPPDRGDRITTYNVIRMLKEIGKVRIGCFVEKERDKKSVTYLNSMGYEVFAQKLSPSLKKLAVLRFLPTKNPLTLPYFYSRKLKQKVDEWIKGGCDLCMCYSSSMGQYVLYKDGFTKIMQFAELDSDKWLQLSNQSGFPGSYINGREAKLLLEYEKKIARDFDLSLVVSDVEKKIFMERIPDVEPLVVENGVDFDYFCPNTSIKKEEAIVFTGVMNYPPNVMGVIKFVNEVWPEIRKYNSRVKFYIVGSDPVKSIRSLNGKDGIIVTGRVPDTRPYMDKSLIAVAPLWVARGIQNKVLEAMSMALPVVSTTQAYLGINAEPGKNILIADDPKKFAETVINLLEDKSKAKEIGLLARKHVVAYYDWNKILSKLKGFIVKALNS